MSNPVPLIAWPLLCFTLVLAGITMHLPVEQLPSAFPLAWAGASSWVMQISALCVLATLVFTGLALRQTFRAGNLPDFTGWVLLHALVFAGLWVVLPAGAGKAWLWLLGGGLIAGTAMLSLRSKGAWPSAGGKYYLSARDATADGVVVLLPLIAGFLATQGAPLVPDTGRLLSSFLVYPLYALFQLSIFLAIPAIRLKRMGFSPRAISISCAVVFCLLHWPNPLLMAATGLAMFVWAGQFLRGRSLLALALVMGIAATGFRYVVPSDWTLDLRIGPDYIEKRFERSSGSIGR